MTDDESNYTKLQRMIGNALDYLPGHPKVDATIAQQVVESNPAICAGEPVFRGTRIPVAVVVEQLRAGTPRQELEGDFPQLSQQALDYAEILALRFLL